MKRREFAEALFQVLTEKNVQKHRYNQTILNALGFCCFEITEGVLDPEASSNSSVMSLHMIDGSTIEITVRSYP